MNSNKLGIRIKSKCRKLNIRRGNLDRLTYFHFRKIKMRNKLVINKLRINFSDLGRVRTCNLRSRNPKFYPVELRGLFFEELLIPPIEPQMY